MEDQQIATIRQNGSYIEYKLVNDNLWRLSNVSIYKNDDPGSGVVGYTAKTITYKRNGRIYVWYLDNNYTEYIGRY